MSATAPAPDDFDAFTAELLRLLEKEQQLVPPQPGTLLDDLGFDSLDALEALIFAEERAGLDRRGPDDPSIGDAHGWTCLGDLYSYHLALRT
jgi:hypothetical protein